MLMYVGVGWADVRRSYDDGPELSPPVGATKGASPEPMTVHDGDVHTCGVETQSSTSVICGLLCRP
jgi:hypothetical protein